MENTARSTIPWPPSPKNPSCYNPPSDLEISSLVDSKFLSTSISLMTSFACGWGSTFAIRRYPSISLFFNLLRRWLDTWIDMLSCSSVFDITLFSMLEINCWSTLWWPFGCLFVSDSRCSWRRGCLSITYVVLLLACLYVRITLFVCIPLCSRACLGFSVNEKWFEKGFDREWSITRDRRGRI